MLLLDTCALIWLANGERMSSESINAIEQAALNNGVLVSPVSAWEIGLLASSKKAPVQFSPSAQQ
jgi:PIN domain nuclease of toxin-antitoxin system